MVNVETDFAIVPMYRLRVSQTKTIGIVCTYEDAEFWRVTVHGVFYCDYMSRDDAVQAVRDFCAE